MPLIVRGGTLAGLDGEPPQLADVLIADGIVAAVGAGLSAPGARVLAARGAWLIPGLWDAHVHFTQWVRSETMLDVSATGCPEEVCARVAEAVAGTSDDGTILFGFGYRCAGWERLGTVAELDAAAGGRAVVLIAGDAHNGWLSSAALARAGLPPRSDPVTEHEWFEAWTRLTAQPPRSAEMAVVARLAERGVVGIVDMEFDGAFRQWPARVAAGIRGLRVRASVYPHDLDEATERGLRTGDRLADGITMGPLKIISDGSMGTRTAWCHEPYLPPRPDTAHPCGVANVPPEELVALLRRAHNAGLEVAVHAIGDRAASSALDAFAATGAAGSIEHAQLLRRRDVPRFAALGVTASMQPHHLIDDRDTADLVWADRTDRLFLAASLLRSGARLALGSDAPVSPLDPWLAIASAVHRSGDDRPAWHPGESLTPREALASCVDGRRITVGAPGDVVVLDADPLADHGDPAATAQALRHMPVRATVCAQETTHLA